LHCTAFQKSATAAVSILISLTAYFGRHDTYDETNYKKNPTACKHARFAKAVTDKKTQPLQKSRVGFALLNCNLQAHFCRVFALTKCCIAMRTATRRVVVCLHKAGRKAPSLTYLCPQERYPCGYRKTQHTPHKSEVCCVGEARGADRWCC